MAEQRAEQDRIPHHSLDDAADLWKSIEEYNSFQIKPAAGFAQIDAVPEKDCYAWSKTIPTEAEQTPDCINWLLSKININTQALWVKDTHSDTSFLDITSVRLPFRTLSGTTSIAICSKAFTVDPIMGLRVSIELKRTVNGAALRKGLAQLTVASLLSLYPCIQIVTDLGNNWVFLWFSDEYTIQYYHTGLEKGLQLLQSAVDWAAAEGVSELQEKSEPVELESISDPVAKLLCRRVKLMPAVPVRENADADPATRALARQLDLHDRMVGCFPTLYNEMGI